jgi:uncharacterized protein (DUF1810 family)
MSLDRFKQAQDNPDSGFATALAELQSGRKTSHWIWYIFPQLASLGRSQTARFYGIGDFAEACAYLQDPVLHERLLRVTEAAAEQLKRGVAITELMGSETDCVKLASSMTLFECAAQKLDIGTSAPRFNRLVTACSEVLAAAEHQGFSRCAQSAAACAALGR